MAETVNPKSVTLNVEELRSSLVLGVKDGYDQVVKDGKMSQASALVTVGYLSAAIAMFDLIGDDHHANLFRATANRINEDWKSYMKSMQLLFQMVDIQGEL